VFWLMQIHLWREIAQIAVAKVNSFARGACPCHVHFVAAGSSKPTVANCQNRYPSPCRFDLRVGPAPFLNLPENGRIVAPLHRIIQKTVASTGQTRDSGRTIIREKGKTPCLNQSKFSPLPHSLASRHVSKMVLVSKVMLNVALLALQRARLSHRALVATLPQVRLSAARLACWPTRPQAFVTNTCFKVEFLKLLSEPTGPGGISAFERQ